MQALTLLLSLSLSLSLSKTFPYPFSHIEHLLLTYLLAIFSLSLSHAVSHKTYFPALTLSRVFEDERLFASSSS